MCVIVKVFPGPHKPYFVARLGYPGGIFVRYGSHNRLADDYSISDLERRRRHISFEMGTHPEVTFTSLSTHLIERVIHSTSPETFISCGYGSQETDHTVKAAHSAVLLFHPNPSRHIPEAYLTITRFAGTDTSAIIKRETFNGSIIEQFEGSFAYLKESLGSDFIVYEKEMIPQHYDYPIDAIRELLINAVVHRAYDYEAPVRIQIFSDRFEILNPGVFYAPITESTLRDGLSRYRNPVIAQSFRKLSYMEKQGVGINRIITSCLDAGLAHPRFMELEHFVKVVLYKYPLEPNRLCEAPTHFYNMPEREKQYIQFFRDNEAVTSREFAQMIGKSVPMAKKILFSLCHKGRIKKVGKARATYYVLNR